VDGRVAIIVLIVAAALLACCPRSSSARSSRSSSLRPVGVLRGVSSLPTIGNLAEHLVAVQLAAKDKMEFAMAVSLRLEPSGRAVRGAGPGAHRRRSSVSRWTSSSRRSRWPQSAAAVGISALIALDGESNWLEGALLMLVYASWPSRSSS
jgi:Ca2+:H+ antiporter